MGRPLLDSTRRRRNAVSIRLTDAEYERLFHVAIKDDAEIAAWIRSVILKECEQGEAKP